MNNEFDNIVITREPERTSRPNWKLLSVVAAGVLLLGTLLGSIVTAKGWLTFASAKSGDEPKAAVTLSNPALDQNIVLNGGFAQIAKAVTPAVVTIEVSARESSRQRSPFGFIDPFRDFFGLPDQDDEDNTPRRRAVPTPRAPQGQQSPEGRGRLLPNGVGSGVLVTGDGYIITNNHVVDGAEKVEVELQDRRKVTAKVIGTDAPSDLAIIKIEGSGYPTIAIGDSDAAQVGDIVLAVGNPLGVGQTVTMGIISARGRSTYRGNFRNAPYEDFIQTDAAINRGNSGGALINLRGELIGIPSQILAGGSGGSIGIGFAIPSKMARNVMDQIIKGGKVRRGKLGVIVTAVSNEYAKELGYKSTLGAFVSDVEKGQPADQAGIKPYDIITEFNGKRIQDSSELRNLTSQTAPGTPVKLKVWRDGSERELTVKLAEVEPTASSKEEPIKASANKATGPLAGVSVENLTPEKAREYRLPAGTTGVVITDVDADSDAAAAGLAPGLVIIEVARQPVTNVSEFNAALQKIGPKKSVFLRVRDGNSARVVLVQPQE
jgi:Do/DeqQ family serine protease